MGGVGGQAGEGEESQWGRTLKMWDLCKIRLHLGALFENLDTHLFGSTRAVVQAFSSLALLLFQGKVKLQERKANSCQGPGIG